MLLQRQMAAGQRLRVIWAHSLYWHKVALGVVKEATPGSSKWLVVFDPLAQACQNSLKSTAVCEEAFSVSPRNSTASQRTLSAGFAVAAVQSIRNTF